MRTWSVSMPRSTRKALCGASVPPVSIWTRRMAAMRSARPDTPPASTSEWPPIHLVSASITRSAPSSAGRHSHGDANVLSTLTVMPRRWARSISAARSDTTIVGLAMVSTWSSRVFGRKAASTASWIRGVDERRLDAEARQDLVEQVLDAAVDLARGDDVVALRSGATRTWRGPRPCRWRRRRRLPRPRSPPAPRRARSRWDCRCASTSSPGSCRPGRRRAQPPIRR